VELLRQMFHLSPCPLDYEYDYPADGYGVSEDEDAEYGPDSEESGIASED